MKSIYLFVGIGALLLLIANQAQAAPQGDINFSDLPSADVDSARQVLQPVETEMINRGYSTQQILYMLSQILFETGLFTDQANWYRINQWNLAGLTNVGGGYASFNSPSDFMDSYEGFLTKGSNPIGASSLSDFNNRLVANHYYTENPAVYLNGLQSYYNLLTNSLN